MEKDTAEKWVKAIGIIEIIIYALTVLGGIFMVAGGSFFSGMFNAMLPVGEGSVFAGMITLMGVIILVVGIVGLIAAIQLLKYKKWARILLLVFAGIGFIMSIFSLNILGIIIDGGIFYLLMFQKEIAALFTA